MSSVGVSVVVPVYNDEEWLSETLDSVRQQTLAPERMEVIVIDDGSTDGSRYVAEDALEEAEYPSTVISIPNGGPSRARNVGWRQAEGEWIQFLDADDLLGPHKLEHQLRGASNTLEEAALLYSNWQELERGNDGWQPTTIRTPLVDEDPSRQLLESQNFVHLGCALIRKSWLDRIGGFNEEYSLVEDVHLQLRLALAGGQFEYVPAENTVFFYRKLVGGHSLSGRAKPAEFWTACVRNADLAERAWRERDAMTAERKRTLLDIYFQAARTFAGTDPDRFQSVWRRIQCLNPDAAPRGSVAFRGLSKVIGFPKAARVASFYHRFKSLLQ